MNTTTMAISLADPLGTMLASGWAWHDSGQPIIARTQNYLLALATGANKLRDEAAAQRDFIDIVLKDII